MGMMETRKLTEMAIAGNKQDFINLEEELRKGPSALSDVLAGIGVSIFGFINPITAIVSFSFGVAYSICRMEQTVTSSAIANELQGYINTMNNDDNGLLKLKLEIVYEGVQDLQNDEPSYIQPLEILEFTNTGSTLYDGDMLEDYLTF